MQTDNKAIFFSLASLFLLAGLFQNCAGSDFDPNDYADQSSLSAPPPTTGAPPQPVINPPSILTKSGDLTLSAGQPATFSVSAEGQSIFYEWYKDGVKLAGETNSNLAISAVSAAHAGSYGVTVNNSAGTATTTFLLTILASPPPSPPPTTAPVITTRPNSFNYLQRGSRLQLQVVASGSNLSYQWYKDGVALTGQTSSVYSVLSVNLTHAGVYRVVVSNAGGSVFADATVEVDPEPPALPPGGGIRPGLLPEIQ